MKNRPMGNIPCLREIPLLSEPDSFQSSFNISCSPLPSHLQSILLSLCLSFLWEQLPLILKFQGQNIAKCSSRLQVDIVSLSLQRKKKNPAKHEKKNQKQPQKIEIRNSAEDHQMVLPPHLQPSPPVKTSPYPSACDSHPYSLPVSPCLCLY